MKKRLLATILFVFIFSAVSLYIIILAQGNRIADDGTVVNTSIIRINTIPNDVKVYIDDQEVEKLENTVQWLNPGINKVTIKKDGYTSWEKIINLKAGVVEDIYAQLYPERLQFERLTNKNIDQFYMGENSDFLFYTVMRSEISKEIGVWRLKLNRTILDFSKSEPEKVFDFSNELRGEIGKYTLLISPDNSKAFLNSQDSQILYLLDFNTKVLTNINEIIGFYPQVANWIESSSLAVFSTDQLITAYDINSKQINLVNFSGINTPVYSTGSNSIYYYRKDLKQIFQYQSKNNTVLKIKDNNLDVPDPLEIIISKDSDKIVFVRTLDKYYFIDLDRGFTYSSLIKGELLKVSPSGKSFLEKINDTTLLATYFEENLDNKTYAYNTNEFTIDESLEFLNYTDNSQNIIFVTKNNDNRKVWLGDYDGLNLSPVIQNEVIASNKVLISNNSIDLYVLLEDSSSAINESTVNNIYKFKLKID